MYRRRQLDEVVALFVALALAAGTAGCGAGGDASPWTLRPVDVEPLDTHRPDAPTDASDTTDRSDISDARETETGCDEPSDCPSGICDDGECAEPTCRDGVQNGDETDVDCGGPRCPGCELGDHCLRARDCATSHCSGPNGETCARCPSGETREQPNSCGYERRGTRVQRCRNLRWENVDCKDVWFGSCREIADARPTATSGEFEIDPDGPSGNIPSVTVTCDMETDGGGWTEITPCLAQQTLKGKMVAETKAPIESGIDDSCRPFTLDEDDRHDYHYTFQFPNGFSEFYLKNYAARANSGPSHTSELGFTQRVWARASVDFENSQEHDGDISFGSPSSPGPLTSFSRAVSNRRNLPQCPNCTIAWSPGQTIYSTRGRATAFRIGWGEAGPQHEGWYPWWQGSIWLR